MNSNPTLGQRINNVIHTKEFEECLLGHGIDVWEFQSSWLKLSGGEFCNLPQCYKDAILAGEGATLLQSVPTGYK